MTLPQGPAEVVDAVRHVRGVVAAAVVGVDGVLVAASGDDLALLKGMRRTAVSALAAAEAFADLVDAAAEPSEFEDGATPEGTRHVTVLFQGGYPLLFEPLAGGQRVVVVAVASQADIGRARFQLRRLRTG